MFLKAHIQPHRVFTYGMLYFQLSKFMDPSDEKIWGRLYLSVFIKILLFNENNLRILGMEYQSSI